MKLLPDNYRVYGDNVYLRPILMEDTDMLLEWRNAPYVVNNFFYRVPVTKDEHINWMRNKVAKGSVYQYIVCLKSDDSPLGCVYLQHYEEADNSMESGVFMSEGTPKGKGIGTEAVRLLNYDIAFGELGLSKTYAKVIDENIGSLKLHEKAGFREILREPEKIVPTGEMVTCVTFELNNPKIQ